jgi:hypothetical protein
MKRTYRVLHAIGITPWASDEIPAELRDLVTGPTAIPPGVALDLGCGTGEHARFLAELGWQVTAVDFVPAAVARARGRDRAGHITWRVADVTRPEQVDPQRTLAGTVRLVLDVGCLHGLAPAGRAGWAVTVSSVASPTSTLLVRAAPPATRGIGPAGIDRDRIGALLDDAWELTDHLNNWYRYDRRAETMELPED